MFQLILLLLPSVHSISHHLRHRCVSAWNDNGLLPHAQNDALLTRTSWFPGLGWMMPRQQWEPLSSRWPKAATTGWYDIKMITFCEKKEFIVLYQEMHLFRSLIPVHLYCLSWFSLFQNHFFTILVNVNTILTCFCALMYRMNSKGPLDSSQRKQRGWARVHHS